MNNSRSHFDDIMRHNMSANQKNELVTRPQLMGASTSQLSPEEVQELQEISNFNAKDIKKLYTRFQRLDRSNNGVLTTADFQLIPELSMNPLCHRIIAVLDKEKRDQVNFAMFVRALSIFSDKATPAAKLKFAFEIYDVDGDGFISSTDLFHVLKLMCGQNIDALQLEAISQATIAEADIDKDGKINLAEFEQVMKSANTTSALTMQFL